jgi:hypothetical protein
VIELNEEIKQIKQVKSKERVAEHGEVFTNDREVNAMLDLVKHETERIESRFLEPACGNGNFLTEVLTRKLSVVNSRYRKSQIEWEKNALVAATSIYGVDILEDNVIECRNRLYNIISKEYLTSFATYINLEYLKSVKFIFKRNILWGNALDFTNPISQKPIIFSEWSLLLGDKVLRRDYIFKFLVEKTHQFILDFNDEGRQGAIDEPVKDYPPIHYLKLGR